MDPLDFIKARRSIRKYKQMPIPEKIIQTILEAGRVAPSARNNQPWKFVVITNPRIIENLASASLYKFISKSPLIIAGCSLPMDSQLGPEVDVIIAMDHMSLTAANLGVGNCWVAGINAAEVARILNVPHGVKVVTLMAFGYPNEKPAPIKRKTSDEVISYDNFKD